MQSLRSSHRRLVIDLRGKYQDGTRGDHRQEFMVVIGHPVFVADERAQAAAIIARSSW